IRARASTAWANQVRSKWAERPIDKRPPKFQTFGAESGGRASPLEKGRRLYPEPAAYSGSCCSAPSHGSDSFGWLTVSRPVTRAQESARRRISMRAGLLSRQGG